MPRSFMSARLPRCPARSCVSPHPPGLRSFSAFRGLCYDEPRSITLIRAYLDLLDSDPQAFFVLVGATVSALLVGFTFHEFSHALAATSLGDPTPRYRGRLSLNPLVHLDPAGTVLLFL